MFPCFWVVWYLPHLFLFTVFLLTIFEKYFSLTFISKSISREFQPKCQKTLQHFSKLRKLSCFANEALNWSIYAMLGKTSVKLQLRWFFIRKNRFSSISTPAVPKRRRCRSNKYSLLWILYTSPPKPGHPSEYL